MKKKIIYISIMLILAIYFLGAIIISIFKNYADPIGNKTSEIFINDNGTIDVIDSVQVYNLENRGY